MKKPVVLRIYKGEQLLGVKQFQESQIVIGRPGEVNVALEGDRVSAIHAAIEERDSGYYICDLGSENGTLKNGEPVLDSTIESGDTLQIGEFKLEFYIGVPKPKAPPPPSAVATAPAPPPPAATAPMSEPPPVPASAPAPASTSAPVSASASADPFEPVAAPADAPVASRNKTAESPPAPKETKQPQMSAKSTAPSQPTASQSSKPSPSAAAMAGVGVAMGDSKSGAFSLAGPKAGQTARSSGSRKGDFKKKHKKRNSFAPASRYNDVRDYVKPSKGTVVEVLVAWRERVIGSYHFSHRATISIGSHPDCEIVLPLLTSKVRKMPILKIESQAHVLVSPEMSGELIKGQASSSFGELQRNNRMVRTGAGFSIALEQGEMVKVELGEGVSLIVRYVSDSPKPLVAPLLDLTTSEFTGVVLSFVLVSILGLYMFLYSPPKPLEDEASAEPLRTAVIILPTPKPMPPPPQKVEVAEEKPQPTPPPVVQKATPSPKKEVVKEVAQAKAVTNLTKKSDPGMSAAAAPNKNKTGPRSQTSVKQGGETKSTDKPAAQMQSKSRDLSRAGLFSTFGGGGANDQAASSTTGSGELAGLAGSATGKSGYAENRDGNGLGSRMKDTGVGGNGKALEGIAGGIGTQGRGSGNSGYGTGGLGNKAGTKIVTGGAEESISGTIDREAIRRVILANLRVIRTCYERQLNRNPDLMGKLILSWDIGEQGRVVGARVKSNELGNRDVADCIIGRLKTWKFPEPPTNQVVEVEAYPFFFSN